MEALEEVLGAGGCRGSPAAEARVQAAVRDLLAAEAPPEALRSGLPRALLRLRAGRRETIVLALRALLRAGNRGWLDRAGLRAYWRYFSKVGAGFPACVQALVAPAAAGGAYPGAHLQVDVCAFVESLTLLLFPQVFGPALCAEEGEAGEESCSSGEGAPLPSGGGLSEGLLLACLGAVQMLARRLRFLHWEWDPDLAMALHTLLGQLQDQARWPERPPWPSSAAAGAGGAPSSSASKAAVAELEAARSGLLEALQEEGGPAPEPPFSTGGPLERMRAGVRGWRPGRGAPAPAPAAAGNAAAAWGEAGACVEAGMRAASAAEILQPLMRGTESPARSAPAPLPSLPGVPRGLFVISEDAEALCPTPPASSARGALLRKVFARVAGARLESGEGAATTSEEAASGSSSASSPALSHSGSSASPLPGEEWEASPGGTPPAAAAVRSRSRKRPPPGVPCSTSPDGSPRFSGERDGGAAPDSPGYRARFFKAFREAEDAGKERGGSATRPLLGDVRRQALAALDRLDAGLAGLAEGALGGRGGPEAARPARLTRAQAAALVAHCVRLQRDLARERAAKCPPALEEELVAHAAACATPIVSAASPAAGSAGSPALFSSPPCRHPGSVQRGLGLLKAGLWAGVAFALMHQGA